MKVYFWISRLLRDQWTLRPVGKEFDETSVRQLAGVCDSLRPMTSLSCNYWFLPVSGVRRHHRFIDVENIRTMRWMRASCRCMSREASISHKTPTQQC